MSNAIIIIIIIICIVQDREKAADAFFHSGVVEGERRYPKYFGGCSIVRRFDNPKVR